MDQLKYMKIALKEAQKAADIDEVPVGAIIIGTDGSILAKAHNLKELSSDPCGHAEIIAIQAAAKKLETWRLTGCQLYVTLEPCMMCTGAIIQSRLDSVHFGAPDPKGGFVQSMTKGFDFPHNHKPTWTAGLLELECSSLLKAFFKEKRTRKLEGGS